MVFFKTSILAGLAASVAAQDLLFVDTFEFQEFTDATASGFTTKVVTEAEYRNMTTSDFSKFKAIIMSDPSCGTGDDSIKFLDDTKGTWSPAVTGNIILIGTDPSFHFSGQPGAGVLIHNAIEFAAAGNSTGLYFSLSCYYGAAESSEVPALSEFGNFTVRGNLGCYNNAHIVASSPALGTLDDVALSNWSCSVHEAFSNYPTTGVNGFQALAIARDIIGAGSQTFGDTSIGLPYIISRGATPAACGDGKWNPELGEECDDGNIVNGDGCSLSCKCESGRPKGDGTCLPPIISSSASSSSSSSLTSSSSTSSKSNSTSSSVSVSTSIISGATTTSSTNVPSTSTSSSSSGCDHSSSKLYGDSTKRNSPVSLTSSASYSYPSIIGVEVIVVIQIVEDCSKIGNKTVTSYKTKPCSTLNRPIYNTEKPGYPCYVCALTSESYSYPSSGFITATTTLCTEFPSGYTHTPKPPVLNTCGTCAPITLSTCPTVSSSLPSGEPDYIIVAPSSVPHEHHSSQALTHTDTYAVPYSAPASAPYPTASASAPAGSPAPTGEYVPAPVPYTGSAAGVGSVFVALLGGVVMLAVAVLL